MAEPLFCQAAALISRASRLRSHALTKTCPLTRLPSGSASTTTFIRRQFSSSSLLRAEAQTSTPSSSSSSGSPLDDLSKPLEGSSSASTTLPGQSQYRSPSANTFRPRGRSHLSPDVHRPYTIYVLASSNNTILTLCHTAEYGRSGYSEPLTDEDLEESSGKGGKGIAGKNLKGSPILWVSAGRMGFKKAQRGSYEAATQAAVRMFQQISLLVNPPRSEQGRLPTTVTLESGVTVPMPSTKAFQHGAPSSIDILFRGFGPGRDAVYRALMSPEGYEMRRLLRGIGDRTPISIGGGRARKRRKL